MLPRLKRSARETLCARAAGILATWVAGKSPATCRAYAADLGAFASWAGAASTDEAVAAFLALGPGKATAAAERWRGSMDGLAPRTVARRLATLRSIVRQAKRQGATHWTLDVDGPKIRGFTRDTRGPATSHVARVVASLAWGLREAANGYGWLGSPAAAAVRDLAVILLLNDSGLRRSEVCSLHVRHVDLDRAMVQPAEKGAHGARQWWPISRRAAAALAAWLTYRTRAPGPVFIGTHGLSPGVAPRDGLTPSAVYRIVRRRAEAVGLHGFRPHGFRHSAITEIQRTTGDLVLAQRFGRHASPATTSAHYVDAEPEHVRQLVEIVAAASSGASGSGSSPGSRHASARRDPRGVRSPDPSQAQHR